MQRWEQTFVQHLEFFDQKWASVLFNMNTNHQEKGPVPKTTFE